MLISVLIPTFNRADMLNKCIESVLRQTYKNIEIIVSDNASSDNTEILMQKLLIKDVRIQYHRNKENIGLMANFSKLVHNLAKGDFAIFLSDDDEFNDNHYLEEVSLLLNKYEREKISFVFSNCINDFIDEKACELYLKKNFPEKMNGKFFFENHKNKKSSGFFLSPPLCTTVFNLELCKKVGGFNNNADYLSIDLMTFLRMSLVGDILYTNTIGSKYRIYSKNTCNTTSIKVWLENIRYLVDVRDFSYSILDTKVAADWFENAKNNYYQDMFSRVLLSDSRSKSLQNLSYLLKKTKTTPCFRFVLKYLIFFLSPSMYSFLRNKKRVSRQRKEMLVFRSSDSINLSSYL